MNYLQKKKQAIIMMLAAQIVKSAQGYPVAISDSRSGRAADYTIWGNTAAAGKNLIPYPYYNKTRTTNGVTFTDNGDGSVTANGTATANAQFDLAMSLSLDTTKKYTLSRAIDSSAISVMLALYKGSTWKKNIQLTGSNTSITIDFSSYSDIEFNRIILRLVVAAGTTVDNVTIKPQLELGETATEYEPYKAGFVGDKGKNLIPYPYKVTTKTTNGITFTDNGDGSVTVKGTATANAYFHMASGLTGIDTTKRYVLSGGTTDVCVYASLGLKDVWKKDIYSRGEPVIVDFPSYTNIEYDQVNVSMYVVKGTTVDNVTIKPQLELGETATEYEPYRYKIQIVNSGKNLIPYPYNETTKTTNGITFTDNGDGTITVNGTATADTSFFLTDFLKFESGSPRILSGCPSEGNFSTLYLATYGKGADHRDFGSSVGINETTTKRIRILVCSGVTCNNLVFKPQLEPGETATEYVPYRAPSTAVIYRSAPLKKGESINFRSDELPKLTLFEGENNITATTAIKPEKISVDYYEK